MEYFWKQQNDIPEGMGYPLFGLAHLVSIGVTLFLVLIAMIILIRQTENSQKRILKAIPTFMVLLEAFKDLFLITVGRFGVGYLHLHFCSIGIFIFLLREYLPYQWCRDVLGEIAFILILPGSLIALIFADWTVYYPVLNFMNLYSYVWHGLLVLYPALIKLRGEIYPDIRHFWWSLLFLCIIVPPIYGFDKHFGCNYFFVNWPAPDSPLSWLASFMGNPGYLLGYALLVILTILLVYLCIWIVEKGINSKKHD